ncbi:MAG: hypothetical protein ACOX06_01655 [Candidatus Dojkabacteria bacterium]|jgi:hypothetical protein
MNRILDKINLFFVQKVYAQRLEDNVKLLVDDVGSIDSEETLVQRIVAVAMPVAIIAALILLSYGGYMMVSSQGNPEKLQEAKSVITNAIIGLLVVLMSVGILLLLSDTLDLDAFR